MLRDNLVELIEPMLNSAGADPLALYIHTRTPASDDRLPCLKNPRPEGAESSLTESASSPFQAEPAHKDNHVWSEKEECLSVVLGNFILFPRGIQELPRNGQRHHFGLTAARRHLDAIAGEAVVGRQPQVGGSCRISFEQRLPAADFLVFPNENPSLNSFLLRMVVLERTASR